MSEVTEREGLKEVNPEEVTPSNDVHIDVSPRIEEEPDIAPGDLDKTPKEPDEAPVKPKNVAPKKEKKLDENGWEIKEDEEKKPSKKDEEEGEEEEEGDQESMLSKILWRGGITLVSVICVAAIIKLSFIRGFNVSEKIYQKEMDLNLELAEMVSLDLLPSKDFLPDDNYEAFFELLPKTWVAKGNPRLQNFEAWYDDYNIEGMRFTFSNGETDFSTPVYGRTKDRKGTPTKYDKVDTSKFAVRNIQRRFVNTQVEEEQTDHTGFYMVNFGVNMDEELRIGQINSKYESDGEVLKKNVGTYIGLKQRVSGIFGWRRKGVGTLRAINFLLANPIVVEEEEEEEEE